MYVCLNAISGGFKSCVVIHDDFNTSELKPILAQFEKVDEEELKLIYNDREIEDGTKIESLKVGEGSVLYYDILTINYIEVSVLFPEDEPMILLLKPYKTIFDINMTIKERKQIPTHEQLLSCSDTRLEPWRSLSYYCSEGSFTVSFGLRETKSRKFKLNVMNLLGQAYVFDVSPHEDVFCVKARISENNGFHPNIIRLIYNGRTIENGNALGKYGIVKPCKINFLIKDIGKSSNFDFHIIESSKKNI